MYRFFGLRCAINGLGLIDDHKGISFLDQFNRTHPIHPVLPPMNDISLGLFAWIGKTAPKGINIDDHDLNIIAHGKVPNLIEFGAIVDKIFTDSIVLQLGKMLFHSLQGMEHTFFDRD